jgi:hypothetical protein
MKGMTSKLVVVLLAAFGWSLALVRAYHVEPVRTAQSGWAKHAYGYDYVSQVLTINFDELDSTAGGCYCELFAGSQAGGGQYNLSVLTYPGGTPIAPDAHANGNVDHKWVRFKIGVSYPESIIKGKKLEFRFTRGATSPGDSFQFYYDSVCGYNYGQMIAPYPPPTAGTGLTAGCDGHPMSSVV